ncbi:Toll-like receptor 2 [Mactra antiquata]
MTGVNNYSVFCFVITCVCLLSSVTPGDTIDACRHNNDIHVYNCSGLNIVDVPDKSEIPNNIKLLDLSNNDIGNVTFLNYDQLTDCLKVLNLSKNRIHALNAEAFKILINLETLDLSNNLLTGEHLEENNFANLDKLLTVNMSRNPLRQIKSKTFSFMELGAIVYLDLSHSEISLIEPTSMDLPSLERLDLSWNKIQTLDETMFKMMVNLLYLDLSHNEIQVLTEIPYMPELISLNLDYNIIQEIQVKERMELYTDKLEYIYIRYNDIIFFNETSFPLELESLQVIDMSNNELQCDCNMKWIKEETYDFQKKNFTFICDHPKSVKSKDLLSLSADDLTCGRPLVLILSVFVVLSVGLFVVGLITFFAIRRCRKKRQQKHRGDNSGDYTAVYNRDEDVRVAMADDKNLISKNNEFDV